MAGESTTVHKQRGRGGSSDDTSPAFLIDGADGGIDAVSRALADADGIGDVATDVTEQVLAKQLYLPNGRWELLIQLRGQRWVILTRSGTGTELQGWERAAGPLARQLRRPVIAASAG